MESLKKIHDLVRFTRLRLGINRFFSQLSLLLLIAASAGLLGTVLERTLALGLPLLPAYVGLGLAALLAAVGSAVLTCESSVQAAVKIDRQAGLAERISSVLLLEKVHFSSPWAVAMRADALRVVTDVRPRQAAPFRAPPSLGWMFLVLALAGGVYFWLPQWDLLGKQTAQKEQVRKEQELTQAREQLKKQLAEIDKRLPDKDLLKGLDPLADPQTEIKLNNPEKLRAEAVKRLDQLKDKLETAKDADKFKALEGLKQMLGQLKKEPKATESANKLSKALQEGDFKQAKQAVQELEETLAREKTENKKEKSKQAGEDLEKLAREISQLAKREDVQQALKNSGLNEEQIQHALDTLSKRDLDQLAEELKKAGLSPERCEKLLEKAKEQLGGEERLKKLCDKLQEAAKQCKNGKSDQNQQVQPGEGDSESAMDDVENELSDMEAMDQQLNDIESALNQAEQAQEQMAEGEGGSGGMGEGGECEGDGLGQNGDKEGAKKGGYKAGIGMGGANPQKEAPHSSEKLKTKTHQNTGAVLKRWSEDGVQIKGEAKAEFTNVAEAAQREAAEAVNKDQIPRQYQNAVRDYFSGLNEKPAE